MTRAHAGLALLLLLGVLLLSMCSSSEEPVTKSTPVLVYGWVEEEPDTFSLRDSTGTRYPVEFNYYRPVEAAIYDTDRNEFLVRDSIPETVVDTTHLTLP